MASSGTEQIGKSFLMWTAIAAILGAIANGIGSMWAKIAHHKEDMSNAQKLGQEKSINEIHKDNAARRKKADAILAKHVKKGKALIDSIRKRNITDNK